MLSSSFFCSGLRVGLYATLLEWLNPLFLADQAAGWATRTFVDQVISPDFRDLAETYTPDLWWSDGDWAANSIFFFILPSCSLFSLYYLCLSGISSCFVSHLPVFY